MPFLLLACLFLLTPLHAALDRPKLQIINGSTQAVDVFWINDKGERVPNGSVPPGKDTIVSTSLGHRFAVVGRDDKKESLVTTEVRVQAFRVGGVPSFYTQQASAGGFPVVASGKVSPYALKEAVYIIDMMLSKRPDVREAMVKSGARLSILAHNEFTCDQPEWAWLAEEKEVGFENLSARDFRDARARGMGGSLTDPYCSCAEENLLAYEGDPYSTENILIHELAHNIHLRGMINVDSTFDQRVKASYDAAMKVGLWKGKYASVNHHEYFAEGVQSWFDNNREPDHDHNHVNTRAELLDYDPGLAALCREVFGDTVLKYTKPQTRLTGHLEGYDPKQAPKFTWPPHLEKARELIRAKARARSDAANKAHETKNLVGWTLHISPKIDAAALNKALPLLQAQLEEIVRVVPAKAVVELQKVPLWINPVYPKVPPRAEYHPGAGWLKDNGRDPAMAKGVEFTNVRIFEAETRRMPNFALHELAHAFHDRVLGFEHPQIEAAYQKAKAAGLYDRVQRQDSEGRKRLDRAYAMTNAKEYFAECSEAFFTKNDFFPFTRDELQKHDPEMYALLAKLWGASEAKVVSASAAKNVSAAKTAATSPNILYLLADDLGYGDLGCYNKESKIPTPRLDQLAREGMRFTDAHSPDSVCTPTRYALLTGRYAWRTRLQRNVLGPWDKPLIAPERLTVGKLLQQHGYTTACIGKWHLGQNYATTDGNPVMGGVNNALSNVDFTQPMTDGPITRGFDHYFGTIVPNYPPYCFIENDRTLGIPSQRAERGLFNIPGPMVPNWRLVDILPGLTRHAVKWIEDSAKTKQPFFLYFPLTSPHYPVVPAPEFIGKSGAGEYGDFVHQTDWTIGQVLDALHRSGAAENTLVIFTSDNGAEVTGEVKPGVYDRVQQFAHRSSGDLRGAKRDAWEGGHRVPFIARWPGKIQAGAVSTETMCHVDFMATVAALLDAKLPDNAAEDSVNVLPVLLGQNNSTPVREATIHHSAQGKFAIRKGDWVLIDAPSGDDNNAHGEPAWLKAERSYTAHDELGELFNLREDPAQQYNRYAEQPQLVTELKALLKKYQAEGRSTPGTAQTNDVPIQPFVPRSAPVKAESKAKRR